MAVKHDVLVRAVGWCRGVAASPFLGSERLIDRITHPPRFGVTEEVRWINHLAVDH